MQTALDAMDEIANSPAGNSVRFEENDERTLKIIADPVQGISKFPKKDGSPKQEFRFMVLDGVDTTGKTWFVTNWKVIKQLSALRKMLGLNSFINVTIKARVKNKTSMNPDWFLDAIDWPGKPANVQSALSMGQAQAPGQGQTLGSPVMAQQVSGR